MLSKNPLPPGFGGVDQIGLTSPVKVSNGYRAEAMKIIAAQRMANPKKNLQRAGYPFTQAKVNYGFRRNEQAHPFIPPRVPTYPTTVKRERPANRLPPSRQARIIRECQLGKAEFESNRGKVLQTDVKKIIFGD
jgi:hypothetical protein